MAEVLVDIDEIISGSRGRVVLAFKPISEMSRKVFGSVIHGLLPEPNEGSSND